MDRFVSGGSLRPSGKIPENGLWKEVIVFVRVKGYTAERDGKKLSVDDTPREASSGFG
jgi:hypothetical protein